MMRRFIQHEPLFVRHFTTAQWPFPVHNHNHYELVFVHSGRGNHEWNGMMKAYEGPHLFLLAPDDFHIFLIEQATEFSVLKFSKTYLDEGPFSAEAKSWQHFLEQSAGPEKALALHMAQTSYDLTLIEQVVQLVVNEWQSAGSTTEIIRNLILVIFATLKKIVVSNAEVQYIRGGSIMEIMDYIHEHIYQPEFLRIAALAETFHYSPNYLNQRFKEAAGTSIKRYISERRFFLIQERMKHSNDTIKTICNKFGFSDPSHFNKFIKSFTGKNPSDFERQLSKLNKPM